MWSSEPLGVPGSILLVSGKRYGRKCVPCLPRKRTALRWPMHRAAMTDAARCDGLCTALRFPSCHGTVCRPFFCMEPFGLLPGFVRHIVVKAVSGFRGIMKCIREKPNAGSMPPRTLFERKTGLDSHHCALRLERRGSESRCPANPVCMNTRSLPRDIVWQASLIFLLECGLSCRQALRGRALHKLYVREHM